MRIFVLETGTEKITSKRVQNLTSLHDLNSFQKPQGINLNDTLAPLFIKMIQNASSDPLLCYSNFEPKLFKSGD